MTSETIAFTEYNVREEIVLFGQEHEKFVKKYSKNGELSSNLWRKLYNLCKRCNTEDGSRDWNAVMGKDTTINGTENLVRNMGYTFFHLFNNPDVNEKQRKKCADFIKDKLSSQKEDRKVWIHLLKKRHLLWSGKPLINDVEDPDERDGKPLHALKNWQYVFDLLEVDVINSATIFRIFLTFSENVFGGKIGSRITHMACMDVWRDNMVWALREKCSEEKYFKLALQPSGLNSLNNDEFEIKRVRLLWQIGRVLALHQKLSGPYFGASIGEALKWCLDPDDYNPTQQHFHLAAEMICHLCVPPIDIPFRTENIKKLVSPLTPSEFLNIAPAITNEMIRLICLVDTKKAELAHDVISHSMTCLLSAMGKCSVDILPSLSRIAEFVDQQAHSKQATAIIKDILVRIPPKLIQKRFPSEDTDSGFSTVAMTLLKVTLKTNGHHLDEAKKIVNTVLASDEHLAALDQISITLRSEALRPSSSVVQILKLWTLTAELFSHKISRGQEVSNEPNETDLVSILNFFTIPFMLPNPLENATCSVATLQKFKNEFKQFFKIVSSSASTMGDYSKDRFVASIIDQIFIVGLDNIGDVLSLQLLDHIIQPETTARFMNPSHESYKHLKHQKAALILQTVSERPNYKDFNAEPTEASLSITLKFLHELNNEHFAELARLLPHYAQAALNNRKCPTWQESLDLIIRILDQLGKSNRSAVEMYESLEQFLIILLSTSSSKRMKILAVQVWEVKFKDEDIILGDQFWILIEPFYVERKWASPKGRTVLAELNSSEISNKPFTGITKRDRGKCITPKRFNRQQAAMAALSGGLTPTRSSKKKPLSSTFASRNDDSDFVAVESPISFNKRKLSARQKEKMKEKQFEQGHIPATYSTLEKSESRVARYLDDSTTQASTEDKTAKDLVSMGIDLSEMDESAVDITFNVPKHSSTVIQSDITSGAGCGNSFVDETGDTTQEMDQTDSISKTLGIAVGNSFTELNETNDELDENTLVKPVDSEASFDQISNVNKTKDRTFGIAVGESFAEDEKDETEDMSNIPYCTEESKVIGNDTEGTIGEEVQNTRLNEESEELATEELVISSIKLSERTSTEDERSKNCSPNVLCSTKLKIEDGNDKFVVPEVDIKGAKTESVVISDDEEVSPCAAEQSVVCLGELESSTHESFFDDDTSAEIASGFSQTLEKTETEIIDLSEDTEPQFERSKIPRPNFEHQESVAPPITSTPSAQEALESDDDDFDEAGLTRDELQKNVEASEDVAIKSPSILKRKRLSTDASDLKKPRRSVSFSDPFVDSIIKSRLSRAAIGGLSPSARRLSRSGRMLQMANEGESIKILTTQEDDSETVSELDQAIQLLRVLQEKGKPLSRLFHHKILEVMKISIELMENL